MKDSKNFQMDAAECSNKAAMPVTIETTNEWLMSVQRSEVSINGVCAEDEIVFFVCGLCPEHGCIIDTPVSITLDEAKRLSVVLDKMSADERVYQ